MGDRLSINEPYKPSLIHSFYHWIDRLPGPYWLFPVVFLIVTGLLNLAVAWQAKVLPLGEINWYYASTGTFVAYFIFANDFLLRMAKKAVSEFLTIVDVDETECQRIVFEFTHLPARSSTVFFVLGAMIGLWVGAYLFPTAAEMNHAFPVLELSMYSLSVGLGFITIYFVLRASRLIGGLFDEKVNIDLFDQASLYAISRYAAWLVIITAILTYLAVVLVPSFVGNTATFGTFLLMFWLTVLIMFWLPLRAANRLLVSEKRKLMKEANLRIRTNFDRLHSKMDNQEYKDIADIREMIDSLQIERTNIESIRTWPWQTSTVTGLFTALLLPAFLVFLNTFLNKFFAP